MNLIFVDCEAIVENPSTRYMTEFGAISRYLGYNPAHDSLSNIEAFAAMLEYFGVGKLHLLTQQVVT